MQLNIDRIMIKPEELKKSLFWLNMMQINTWKLKSRVIFSYLSRRAVREV